MCGQSKEIVPLNTFNQDDGLASLNIRKIIQDQFGFIWLATQGGLSRFDGHNFTNYRPLSPDSRYSILNNDVADISFSKDSLSLFAVTPYGGISIIDLQTGLVRQQCPLASLPDGRPVTVTKCIADGDFLYISTDEGHFLKYDTRKQKIVRQVFFKTYGKLAYIISNYTFLNGRLSIFLSSGDVYNCSTDLKLLSKGHLNIQADAVQGVDVNKILPINDSICVLATNKGLRYYNVLSNEATKAPSFYKPLPLSFQNSNCRDIQLYGDNLWLICDNHLWRYTISKGEITAYNAARDPEMQSWISEAKGTLQTENSLYIISGKGLSTIANIDCPFTAYYKSSDGKVKIPLAYAMCSRSDSSIMIAATDGIYREYHDDLSKVYTGQNVNFIAPFMDDLQIASQSGKTFLLDQNFREISITKRFPELSGLAHDLIISSTNIGDSLYLFASDNANGIYCWYPQKKKLVIINSGSKSPSLKSNTLNTLYPASNGEQIIILCDNQLSVYHIKTGTITHPTLLNPITTLPLNIILDICESGGYFWAAVYGTGIVQIDRQFRIVKIYGLKEGLPTAEIYKIIPIDKRLFVSSNKGIILFDTDEKSMRLFTKKEGLQANEFEEYSGLHANGYIYFGGANGFTKITPALVQKNPFQPRFYILHAAIQTKDKTRQIDSGNLFLNKISIPDNWLQARLSFRGINYSNADRLTYAYRIKERDTNWIALGNQDFINLIGMGPGTYHLEARAANEDGYLSISRTLALTVQPRWFQTWWFYLAVALLIIGITYSLYAWRIRQLKRQQEALREMRQEIAGDLHDDIGSVLNAIKLFAHMAEHAQEKQPYFLNIKDSLKQASEGLRDMIWVLDDNNDSVDELLNRLQYLLLPVANASAVELLIIKNYTQPVKLGKKEKRNLLMITKEAVNNSLKYARCNKIIIEFHISGANITVLIQDNGQGYSSDNIIRGNGIKNIHYRAKQINYEVQINAVPGQGVAVLLKSHPSLL
ncbi:Histidine kinase [Chitinophaga sp. YR627]|nr:Histidine kinase [Chitinophaga sp. YR627]